MSGSEWERVNLFDGKVRGTNSCPALSPGQHTGSKHTVWTQPLSLFSNWVHIRTYSLLLQSNSFIVFSGALSPKFLSTSGDLMLVTSTFENTFLYLWIIIYTRGREYRNYIIGYELIPPLPVYLVLFYGRQTTFTPDHFYSVVSSDFRA